MKHVVFSAVVCGAFAVAGVTLPVCEVAERAQRESSVYPGRVVPVAQVDVVPQVSGEILEVCFANGAEVKEGDVLYRIDRVKYEAAVKNAEAKVAECRAKASYAELSYARHMKLVERRAGKDHDLDHGERDARGRKNPDPGQRSGGQQFRFGPCCHLGFLPIIMIRPPKQLRFRGRSV